MKPRAELKRILVNSSIGYSLEYRDTGPNYTGPNSCRPTVCVSRWWAGWDSAGEQEKPEARKMPVSRDESHQSAARFVGRLHVLGKVMSKVKHKSKMP